MNKERRLLFYGELPPESIHGVSISNDININILKKSFKVDIIQELIHLEDHAKISIKKFLNSIRSSCLIISKSLIYRYEYFYLVFSLSTIEAIKTLASIICFRIFNRGKIVLHLHRGDFFSTFYTNALKKFFTKLIFKLSWKIIVLSENQKSGFEQLFNSPFYVLRNTVEAEIYHEQIERDHGCFIFVSNYLIDKGILDLLEVFEDLAKDYKQISIQTFGAFSDNILKQKILNFASVNIIINGPIYGLEKIRKIAQSHCLILPSWNEGQPVILLEVMSVGTPVIASNIGLIPELLGIDYPYLFKPENKEALKEMIIEVYNLSDHMPISQNLRNKYNEFYCHKVHADALNKIFIEQV